MLNWCGYLFLNFEQYLFLVSKQLFNVSAPHKCPRVHSIDLTWYWPNIRTNMTLFLFNLGFLLFLARLHLVTRSCTLLSQLGASLWSSSQLGVGCLHLQSVPRCSDNLCHPKGTALDMKMKKLLNTNYKMHSSQNAPPPHTSPSGSNYLCTILELEY